jgi:uncharacterized protein
VILPDVNVLVYAHRRDVREHDRYAEWLAALATGDERFGLATLTLSGFLRIVTSPQIFKQPTPLDRALEFVSELRSCPLAVEILPGPRHWDLFTRLCHQAKARGKLVPDAYIAALAIEHGCELVTNDADFTRFKGLRWRHALQAPS